MTDVATFQRALSKARRAALDLAEAYRRLYVRREVAYICDRDRPGHAELHHCGMESWFDLRRHAGRFNVFSSARLPR